MTDILCEELISIFDKIGGKLVCSYDTKSFTLFPQNITCKITNKNRIDIDCLLNSFAYKHDTYVSILPESEESKKKFMEERIHNYQEKNSNGFIIEFGIDEDGFIIPKKY